MLTKKLRLFSNKLIYFILSQYVKLFTYYVEYIMFTWK